MPYSSPAAGRTPPWAFRHDDAVANPDGAFNRYPGDGPASRQSRTAGVRGLPPRRGRRRACRAAGCTPGSTADESPPSFTTSTQRPPTGRSLERAETAERRSLVDGAILGLLFRGSVRRSEALVPLRSRRRSHRPAKFLLTQLAAQRPTRARAGDRRHGRRRRPARRPQSRRGAACWIGPPAGLGDFRRGGRRPTRPARPCVQPHRRTRARPSSRPASTGEGRPAASTPRDGRRRGIVDGPIVGLQLRNQQVSGSSPLAGSNRINNLRGSRFERSGDVSPWCHQRPEGG